MLESFGVLMTKNGFILTVWYSDELQGNNRTVWLERDKLLFEIDQMLKNMEGNMHE